MIPKVHIKDNGPTPLFPVQRRMRDFNGRIQIVWQHYSDMAVCKWTGAYWALGSLETSALGERYFHPSVFALPASDLFDEATRTAIAVVRKQLRHGEAA